MPDFEEFGTSMTEAQIEQFKQFLRDNPDAVAQVSETVAFADNWDSLSNPKVGKLDFGRLATRAALEVSGDIHRSLELEGAAWAEDTRPPEILATAHRSQIGG